MSRVLRFVLVGLASLLGLLVVVVAVALLIPDDTYRGWIVDGVASATGRELRIDGEFEITAGKRLAVHATDVHFANAEWGSEPSMASIGSLDAALPLGPLFGGVVAVVLDVDKPEVLLETDESGRGNWEMGTGDAPAETAAAQAPADDDSPPGWTLAPTVQIANGRFRFVDGTSGHTEEFLLAGLGIGAPDGRIAVDLDGQYQGQPVTVDAALGEVERIIAGESTDVKLDAGAGDIALSAEGTWSKLLDSAGPTMDLMLALSAPSTQSAEPFAGTTVPDLGKLDFTGRLAGADGGFKADDLQLTLAGSALNAAIKGQIDDLVSVRGLDLSADISSDDLPAVVEAVGVELPGTVPRSLEAKASVSGGLDALALSDLAARVGEGEVQANLVGSAEDLMAGKGVVADFDLAAPSLSAFSAYAGKELPESGPVSAKAHLASKEETYEVSGIDVSIAGDDLSGELTGDIGDVIALSDVNLNLDALVGSLAKFSAVAGTPMPETGPLAVKAVIAASEGVEGPATISGDLDSDWLSGKIDATIADIAAAQGVDATLDLKLQSLAVFSGIAGRELPPMGPFGVAGKLTSEGETYALTGLDVNVEDENLKARLTGSVRDLVAASGVDVELDAKIGSLSSFSALAGTPLPETKPLSVKARVSAAEGAQGPAAISTTLESDWLNGSAETTIADLLSAGGIDGKANFELTSLADLSGVAGRELPEIGPVKASATVAPEGDSYAVPEFTVLVEDNALRANLKGAVADLVAMTGLKVSLEGSVDTLSSLSGLAGTELPQTPKIDLNAQVRADAGLQGELRVAAEVVSDQTRATLQGLTTDVANLGEAKFELAVDAPTLAAVGVLAGTPLPDVGPLKASTLVRASAQELELFTLKLQLGRSDLAGDAKIIFPTEGTKTNVTGIFRSRLLDIEELSDAATADGGRMESAGSQQEPANAQSGSPDDRVFPDDPVPLDALNLVDAYVELNAQKLLLPVTSTENVNAKLTLENGVLNFDSRASVVGRPVTTHLMADSNAQPPALEVAARAENVSLEKFLPPDASLQGGLAYIDTKLSGRGQSVRDLMASLNGHFTFAVKDARLTGDALALLGQDLLTQINPLTAKDGYATLECSAIGLVVEDGIATTPRGLISLETTATWLGHADINLKNEQINVTFESKAREGLGIGAGGMVAGAVQIGGTLANPTVTPNPVGVATTGLKTALAITTGGTSLLATGLLDRATSEDELCKELLRFIEKGEATQGEGAAPAEQGEAPAQ